MQARVARRLVVGRGLKDGGLDHVVAEGFDLLTLAVAQNLAGGVGDVLDGVVAVEQGHDEAPQLVGDNPCREQGVDKYIFIAPLEDLYLFGKSVLHPWE